MERGTFLWVSFNVRYWPALCISASDVGLKNPPPGYIYIYWFGDGRVSAVSIKKVHPFAIAFGLMYAFQKNKMGPTWKKGVHQAIQIYSSLDANISFFDAVEFAYTNYSNPSYAEKTFVPPSVLAQLKKYKAYNTRHTNEDEE